MSKMKATRYIFPALLFLALAACTSEPLGDRPNENVYELTAYIATDGAQTRTILMDNPGVRVETYWSYDDAITVMGSSGESLVLSLTDGEISGDRKTAIFNSSTALPSGNVSALYPAVGNAGMSGGKVVTSLPDTQHYVKVDGLVQPDPALSVMAGTGSVSGGIAFRNVMSVLKIGQSFDTETAVTAVTFRDLSGKAVAGSISIDPSDNYSSQVSGGSTTMTLDCGEGVELTAGATGVFYMIVPAREYPKGFEVTFITSTGEYISRQVGSSNGVTLGRGVVYPVGEISNREYIAGSDAALLSDNATLMTSEVLQQVKVLNTDWEHVRNSDGEYVYCDNESVYAPYYVMLVPNDMALNEGDYLVFDATDDLPNGGVFQITRMETPYADESHSLVEIHMTTDFAKAFKKLEYGEQLFDSNGDIIEGAGEDLDLASYLSSVYDAEGNAVAYSISEQGQIQISEEDFESVLTKGLSKINKSISSPKLSMTITDPSQVYEANLGAQLSISMRAGIKVEDGELQWVHFMFNPQIKLSGNFAIKGTVSKSKSFHLITLYFVPGIPVAPGVVLTPELEIRGSIGVGGELVFSTSIAYTYHMGEYGFSYLDGQGFTFHHKESEPEPNEKFKPELGASLSGNLYAQGTITAIPSISLFGVFRAGIYVDFSLKFGITVAEETIDDNIYLTRKLFLGPEIALSPYVSTLGGTFSKKWNNVIPKIEFDPIWERYLDPVVQAEFNLIDTSAEDRHYLANKGTVYYLLMLNTQKLFGQMFSVQKMVQSIQGYTYSCKSLRPTLDDWDVFLLLQKGEFTGSWKDVKLGVFHYASYMPNTYTNLQELNRYYLMPIPHNQAESDYTSVSGEILCSGEIPEGEVRSLHLVCVNKSNGRVYTVKESRPFAYYWPETPDGPWWNPEVIDYETYKFWLERGMAVWPSNIPLPF